MNTTMLLLFDVMIAVIIAVVMLIVIVIGAMVLTWMRSRAIELRLKVLETLIKQAKPR